MTDTPTTEALIAELRGRNFDPVNGYFTREDERLMRRAADAIQPRAGASGEREARMVDALQSIREHCAVQPSALAKAIVATCDAALTRSEADEAPGVEIPAGMVAWKGGDSAPADWSDGPAIMVDPSDMHVSVGVPPKEMPWKQTVGWKVIVAYTPIAQPVAPSREAVAISDDRARSVLADAWEAQGSPGTAQRIPTRNRLHDTDIVAIAAMIAFATPTAPSDQA